LIASSIDALSGLFQESQYLAPFTVLLLCGIGLPLPEEVTLIGSGILLHQGEVSFLPICFVCGLAILLGDSIPYFLGRRFGLNALRLKWVSKILHPERFSTLEERFARHGNWAIFTCRFLPGLRLPGYFTAGTLKMPFLRFLLLDLLGVLLSVPLSIHLGRLFGGEVERLQREISNFHHLLAFVVLSLLLVFVVRSWIQGRYREADKAVEVVAGGQENQPGPVQAEKPRSDETRPGGGD
jgi:membrane protein DedA with SNARE-associated domain